MAETSPAVVTATLNVQDALETVDAKLTELEDQNHRFKWNVIHDLGHGAFDCFKLFLLLILVLHISGSFIRHVEDYKLFWLAEEVADAS